MLWLGIAQPFSHLWKNPGSAGASKSPFSCEMLGKPEATPSGPLVLELALLAASHVLQQLKSRVYSPVTATRARVNTTAFRNILGSSLGWDSLS